MHCTWRPTEKTAGMWNIIIISWGLDKKQNKKKNRLIYWCIAGSQWDTTKNRSLGKLRVIKTYVRDTDGLLMEDGWQIYVYMNAWKKRTTKKVFISYHSNSSTSTVS